MFDEAGGTDVLLCRVLPQQIVVPHHHRELGHGLLAVGRRQHSPLAHQSSATEQTLVAASHKRNLNLNPERRPE